MSTHAAENKIPNKTATIIVRTFDAFCYFRGKPNALIISNAATANRDLGLT
jgi:hypothetical protein